MIIRNHSAKTLQSSHRSKSSLLRMAHRTEENEQPKKMKKSMKNNKTNSYKSSHRESKLKENSEMKLKIGEVAGSIQRNKLEIKELIKEVTLRKVNGSQECEGKCNW